MLCPMDELVLVLPDEIGEKTSGGLYLPAESKDLKKFNQIYGKIVAMGPAVDLRYHTDDIKPDEYLTVTVGDKVSYCKNAGENIIDPDTKKQLLLLKQDDIYVILLDSKEYQEATKKLELLSEK